MIHLPKAHAYPTTAAIGLSLALLAACGSAESETVAEPSAPAAEALEPGSLKFIMGGLAGDMTRLSAGLWLDDFEAIRAGATAVADHPHVSPSELSRVRATLGERLPLFVAADRAVHDAAQRVAQAAEARDMERVLRETATLQSGCVSCHARFREALKGD
ncbi:MAG: cytochrome c [Deltaproteobacteria bacterium]|nr:cytochrome c [Deltaproteobacteria bacterium]